MRNLLVPHMDSVLNTLSTALAKNHAKGDISMVTELVNLCAIVKHL